MLTPSRQTLPAQWLASLRHTLADLREFYLTPDERQRYGKMTRLRRFFAVGWWLLRSLFYKLSPARRVLFVVALIMLFDASGGSRNGTGGEVRVNAPVIGTALLIALLLLELKDKLLARHELEAGRAVQMALMPTASPRLEGWDIWLFTRPANDVGGDLVDSMELAPDRLAVALADVAGKALPAALLMAKLQATLRALSTDLPSLSDLAARTNTILCRDGLPNRFATMAYLVLERESGTVRLLNAGHMPPLLVSASGVSELAAGNMALGLMAGTTFHEQTITLDAGTLLVVYSDGVTDALNADGTFFGDDRLRALLPALAGASASEAGHRLLAAVDQFIGDTRPYDDLSLVVLRRTLVA